MWYSVTVSYLILVVSMFILTNVICIFALKGMVKVVRAEGLEPSKIRIVSMVALVNIILSVFCGTVIADYVGMK